MATSDQPINPSQNQDIASELAYVTQQMYKKNFELVERNKTLSVLRKISDIILSKVTDIKQVAQQVADVVVVEAEFKAVIILLLDKKENSLVKLAVSQTEGTAQAELELKRSFYSEKIPLSEDKNLAVLAIKQKASQVTHDMQDILTPFYIPEDSKRVENILGIKSSLIYPLIVRDQVLGAMIICIGQGEEALFQYQKDLIDRLSAVIGIAIDNTLLYKELQQANETLKQLDKLKDEFVSLASHELKTPMTAIKSYLWMALAGKGGELAEKQKHYLDQAYKSTDRLIKMVNDMLNVSRIEAGRIILTLKDVNYNQLITEALSEVTPRAQELGVNIIFSQNQNIPDVYADSDKIKEVIINLVGNSLKFTPKGGNITISAALENNMVSTRVIDTGQGITKEEMTKLFQKFNTSDANYLVKDSSGTGLGLYISKSLITLHKGKIWAESEGEGKGTTFIFTLPVFKR